MPDTLSKLLAAFLVLSWLGLPMPSAATEPGRVEQEFSRRAGEPLRLYGHGLFQGVSAGRQPVLGAIADDHVLGPGDELLVVLKGFANGLSRHRIGADGMLLVHDLPPLLAAGKTLGALRSELDAAVAAGMTQTTAYLSLAEARRLSVLVVGEVARPGPQEVPAFASVLDGLLAAGGVLPGGSLRAIRLARRDGGPSGEVVDLYELMRDGGGGATARLRDGDRLVVPPVGPVVAVAGRVARPGIYELPADGPATSLADLVSLAGGALDRGPPEAVRLHVGADGSERSETVTDADRPLFRAGDVLLYAAGRSDRRGTVELLGHVRHPGPRPLPRSGFLADLLAGPDLLPDAYRPFAVLAGVDGTTGGRRLTAVDLDAVLEGRDGPPLAEGDRLVVLGPGDVAYLGSGQVLSLLAGRRTPARNDCPGLAALEATLSADPGGVLAAGELARAASALTGPPLPCPPLLEAEPDLLPFALANARLLRRGVLRPGPYPAAPGVAPTRLVQAAGGPGGRPAGEPAWAGQVLDAASDGVELVGAVRRPGVRPLRDAPTLRSLLLGGDALDPAAYGLLAVLERFDQDRLARVLVPFAPVEVRAGGSDRRLREGDRVRILTRAEAAAAVTDPPADPDTASAGSPQSAGSLPPDVLALLREHRAWVGGAVRAPGAFPVADGVALADLLQAAGGLALGADPSLLEVASPVAPGAEGRARRVTLAETRVGPGDSVRVGSRPAARERRTVELAGEVAQPGTYVLAAGETLSGLLARAGGLTASAYPYGAVFTRESARREQEAALRRYAAEVDRALEEQLRRSNPPAADRVELARRLSADLHRAQAAGRITVQADPAALALDPAQDISLEHGDRLHVPKRPLTVTVVGEVLSPASLQFRTGKEAEDYLEEAGGLTRNADEDLAFVILPDGSSRPLDRLPDRYRVAGIPPGSTIVVPRDPEPLEFLPLSQSITGILGQLALTAAAIVSIAD